jgi:hypothetical protein
MKWTTEFVFRSTLKGLHLQVQSTLTGHACIWCVFDSKKDFSYAGKGEEKSFFEAITAAEECARNYLEKGRAETATEKPEGGE